MTITVLKNLMIYASAGTFWFLLATIIGRQ